MKNSIIKRVISLLLALVCVLGVLPLRFQPSFKFIGHSHRNLRFCFCHLHHLCIALYNIDGQKS